MTTTQHPYDFATTLDQLASDENHFLSSRWIASSRNALNSAATLIRDLASNQLPDFDSIQPANVEPHAAEIAEKWSQSQRAKGDYTGAAAAARLSLAASWIKARDQEIAALRTALSRVQEPPQAFEEHARVNLGEFLDARAPALEAPKLPNLPELYAMCARLFGKLESSHDAQREHWREMEHQTRRIADANALRALRLAVKLETDEGDALK